MSEKLDKSLFDKENTALVLHGKEDIRLEKWPVPETLEPNGKCLVIYLLWIRYLTNTIFFFRGVAALEQHWNLWNGLAFVEECPCGRICPPEAVRARSRALCHSYEGWQ